MLNDFVKQVHAKQSFKIKDNFKFVEFDDISKDGITTDSPVPDQIEIWTAVEIYYEGKIPDSYKTLNLTIGDWVVENDARLSKVIHEELRNHFNTYYPNSDSSTLESTEESSIWLEQLDYMPRVNKGDNSIIIEIEVVMDTEPLND